MTISVIAVQLYIFAILYLSEREISLTYLKLKLSKSFSYKNAKTEKIVNKMLTHTKNVEFVGNTGILAEKMI